MYTKEELLELSNDKVIDAFLQLTDFDNNLNITIKSQFDFVRNTIGCSDDFMDSFIKGLDIESYKKSTYDLYEKYFTKDELIDIILFYQTETGRSFTKKNILIGNELINVAMAWADKECVRFENMYYRNKDTTLN